MKPRFSNFLIILMASVFCNAIQAQDNETSVNQMMVDAGNHIARIEQNNYKISKLEISTLVMDKEQYTYVKLWGGRKYQILAEGERNRVSDFTVRILDQDRKKVIRDLSNHSNRVEGEFIPPMDAYYAFEFKVSKFFGRYESARYLLMVSFD